ncbi:MAG: nucleoside hydrolase [Kordiimonadaceae bacterium]|nr:nucleoside hydrolase [Kordiimonadaceae bacterium]
MSNENHINRRGVLMVPLMTAFLPLLSSSPIMAQTTHRKIILDVDTGVDDAAAILIANIAPSIELLGITTVNGNTNIYNATRNSLFIKHKFSINAPVIKGADKPINGIYVEDKKFHGKDGLGDAYDMSATNVSIPNITAHDFILKTVNDNPGDVTIVSVGPSTNLALAIQKDPSFVKNVHSVVIMGGAAGFNGQMGNVSPVAEFNIFTDPEASDIVMAADWPLTMVGLDVTYSAPTYDSYFDELIKSAGEAGQFLKNINQYYINSYEKDRGVRASNQHDSMALMYLLHPEIFTTRRGKIKVSTESVFSRGQTIFCPENHSFASQEGWLERPVHQACATVNSDAFLNLFRRYINMYKNKEI